jgi:selenocysteine lyase/cysteine desulfurase
MSLDELRRHFPHAGDRLYFNHAATAPISRPVREAVDRHLDQRGGHDPDTSIDNFEAVLPILAETAERAARVLGTEAGRVALMPNTSTALNVLARGLDWEAGDRVAVPDCEFPTNVYPFLNQRPRGVEVDFVPTEEGTFTAADVDAALGPETRLFTVSWVQFLSGFRADLEALGEACAAHDVIFCVDAIQGLGALQVDVDAAGIDFLACGGHKWLMAPQGTGLLYCRESLQERIRPPAGWLHGPVDWETLDDYELAFHDDARRFQPGTSNSAGIAGLHAALGLHLEAGPAWCEGRIQDNTRRLAAGLDRLSLERYGSRDPDRASGIVTVAPDAPGALAEHLQDRGIRTALRNRKLRFSPHWYNTPGEVDAVLDVVAAFRKGDVVREA